MATISVNTYLDGGTARTAGEAWTINSGAKLTVRTDTRVHANAPASMTGSLGSVTINDGELYFDATATRWMPFDSGTGTVPAIGTTVSQGAVSGYLLGVWASLTSAPTSAGAAMPTSGFIKFREVIGGAFSAGALSGIGASASSPDVVGWIEVVADQSSVITLKRFGSHTTRGDWFLLGLTSGVTGQIFQAPTNGGNNTLIPGVWVETGTGTEQYEFFPAITSLFYSTSYVGTDVRSRFVRVGSNGTVTLSVSGAGYTPPSGCKVAIPNILLRQCATTNRAANAAPGGTMTARPRWDTTASGSADIQNVYGDWYASFVNTYDVVLKKSSLFDQVLVNNTINNTLISDCGIGYSGALYSPVINLSLTTVRSGQIDKWVSTICDPVSSVDINSCSGIQLDNLRAGVIARLTTAKALNIELSSDITCNSCSCINSPLSITSCSNISINNFDSTDNYLSAAPLSASPINGINITNGSSNIVVNGFSVGLGGQVASMPPYSSLVYSKTSSNITIRNIGTYTGKLNIGSPAGTTKIFSSGGVNTDIKIKRVYTQGGSGMLTGLTTDKDVIYESVFGDYADSFIPLMSDGFIKGCSGTLSLSPQTSAFGTHFLDYFTSETRGVICLALNEITSASSVYYSKLSGNPRFNSSGSILMPTIGDSFVFEMPYFAVGHTGFPDVSPVFTGTNTNNLSIEYQIDTGSGFGSSWKALTKENLITEAIDPSFGFKFKIKVTTITTNTTNAVSFISVVTETTASSQETNIYPLDQATLALNGLTTGSEVRCYKGLDPSTAIEIGGVESSGTSFVLSHTETDTDGYIIIHSLNYLPIYLPWTFTSTDTTIPIQQQIERNYKNE